MKAADLPPPERRLLKRCGRIDPHPTKLEPQDDPYIGHLLDLGLIEVVPMFAGRFEGAQITEAGRGALN